MKVLKYWKIWMENGTIPFHFQFLTKEQIFKQKWAHGKDQRKTFVLHHLNNNRSDNNPENLYLMTRYQHDVWHRTGIDHKGEKNSMYGRHHSIEAKKKMSKKAKGRYDGEKNPAAKISDLQRMEIIFKIIQQRKKQIPIMQIFKNIAKEYPLKWGTIKNLWYEFGMKFKF